MKLPTLSRTTLAHPAPVRQILQIDAVLERSGNFIHLLRPRIHARFCGEPSISLYRDEPLSVKSFVNYFCKSLDFCDVCWLTSSLKA